MWRLRGREKYIRGFGEGGGGGVGGGGGGSGGPEGKSSSGDQGVDGNIKINVKEKMGGCEKDSSDS